MADQAKLRKRLETILKLPENQICADCGKRGPRWASANLGVFMCIECSGIHRNLGVHISFVRSVNLDSWQPKQVQFMEEWGNARANAYFEANIPRDYVKPKETDPVRVVERFIRDKYELKRFIASEVPPRMTSATPQEEEAPRRVSRPAARPAAVPATSAPAPVPVAAAKPPQQEPNLIDFFDTPDPPAPVAAAPPGAVPAAYSNGFDNFGAPAAPPSNAFGQVAGAPQAVDPFAAPPSNAFGAPPAQGFPPANSFPPQGFPPQQAPPSANQGFNDFESFGSFSSPAPAAAPQAPKASADAILSLYNTPSNKQQGGGMGGMSMMPPPQQLYGQPQHYQQQHYQQQQQHQQHSPHMGGPMHHPGHHMPQPGHHMPPPYGYPPVPPAGYGMPQQGGPMMPGYPPRGPPGHMPYPPQNGFR